MSKPVYCEGFTLAGRACIRRAHHAGDCKTTPTLAQVLSFEARPFKNGDVKEHQIRVEFDISAVRYYQLLNRYVDTEEATQLDPITTRRVIAQRAPHRTT